jgi:hypothetical protein
VEGAGRAAAVLRWALVMAGLLGAALALSVGILLNRRNMLARADQAL